MAALPEPGDNFLILNSAVPTDLNGKFQTHKFSSTEETFVTESPLCIISLKKKKKKAEKRSCYSRSDRRLPPSSRAVTTSSCCHLVFHSSVRASQGEPTFLARLVVSDDLTTLSSLLSPVACSRRSLHFPSMHSVPSNPLSSLLSQPFLLLRRHPPPPRPLYCHVSLLTQLMRLALPPPSLDLPPPPAANLSLSLVFDLLRLSIRPSLTQSRLDIGRMLVACCHCSSFTCGWVCMKCVFGTSA